MSVSRAQSTVVDFPFDVLAARFVARPNRFLVHARLVGGEVVEVHCPDPGRMQELLVPDATIYISKAAMGGQRRTGYDLRFVEHPENGELVSLDTRLPNKIIGAALAQDVLTPFAGFSAYSAEAASPLPHGGRTRSRFDFRLVLPDDQFCWIEVKSVTLVENSVALFPDAPTTRGRRHVQELAALVEAGLGRAAVIFVVQRQDANVIRPHMTRDPAFAASLRYAADSGVELYGYCCTLTTQSICLTRSIPVEGV